MKVNIGIFMAVKSSGKSGDTIGKPIYVMGLDIGMKGFISRPRWKEQLYKLLGDKLDGLEVLSCNVLAAEKHGCQVAVLVKKNAGALTRRKPMTRGGREIGDPITGKKTMATRRRMKNR